MSPAGEEVEKWTLVAAYPENIKYGDLDYSADDAREMTVTWRYDRAEHAELKSPNGVNVDISEEDTNLSDSTR